MPASVFIGVLPPTEGWSSVIAAAHLLSGHDRRRSTSFRTARRSAGFILGRLLLALMEGQRPVGTSSVSYAGDLVVVAAGSRGAFGVDVERWGRMDDRTARRFFPRAEYRWLSSLPEDVRHRRLATLWAIKEACAKATGTGLRSPLPETGIPLLGWGRHEDLRWELLQEADGYSIAGARSLEAAGFGRPEIIPWSVLLEKSEPQR